jgi:hypothetical protein
MLIDTHNTDVQIIRKMEQRSKASVIDTCLLSDRATADDISIQSNIALGREGRQSWR